MRLLCSNTYYMRDNFRHTINIREKRKKKSTEYNGWNRVGSVYLDSPLLAIRAAVSRFEMRSLASWLEWFARNLCHAMFVKDIC
jgi:hypothetical protein